MSSPAAALNHYQPANDQLKWELAGECNRKTTFQVLVDRLPAATGNFALGSFQYITANHDRKLTDYLFLGVLSILIHGTVVEQFDRVAVEEEEIIEPAKPLPQVQISLSRPQPKQIVQPPPPPPVAKAKPPVPKAVPLKPQKPKPVQKVVEDIPTPSPAPIVDNAQPIVTPTPAPPAPPAPVVEEKVTAPSAGADYLHNPAPQYPEIAMDRGWEGKVLMKVHVLPDGHPDSVSVIKSSGQQVLDDAAVKTVNKWSFVPAKRGDTPIAGWVTVPITFNLS